MSKKLAQVEFANNVTIAGEVSEIKLKSGVSQKDGSNYINGSIVVQVAPNETQEVHVFQGELTKAGEVSKKYIGLQTVMNEYKSIAEVGVGNADKVRITKAKINANAYLDKQTDEEKSSPRIELGFAGFINRVKENEQYTPQATAEVGVIVSNVRDEFNKEGDETGRKIVEGYNINTWNDQSRTDGKITFVISEEYGASEFANLVEGNPLMYINLTVELVNFAETVEKEIPQVFGKPKVKTFTNYKREYQIVSGETISDEDGEAAVFEPEEIKSVMQQLNQQLAAKKQKQEDKNNGGTKKQVFGGNTNVGKKETKATVNTADLWG